jgi:hypothetical protein
LISLSEFRTKLAASIAMISFGRTVVAAAPMTDKVIKEIKVIRSNEGSIMKGEVSCNTTESGAVKGWNICACGGRQKIAE